MEVIISNRSGVSVNLDLLHELAEDVLDFEKVDTGAELSIVLVDENKIKQLNAEYRGINLPTDVLSFPQLTENPTGPYLLGDVVISPQIAEVQAGEYQHSPEKEMAILLIHGILHLLGFDHETPEDKALMEEREKKILDNFLVEKELR